MALAFVTLFQELLALHSKGFVTKKLTTDPVRDLDQDIVAYVSYDALEQT